MGRASGDEHPTPPSLSTTTGASAHSKAAIAREASKAADEIVQKCGPTTSADGVGGLLKRITKAPAGRAQGNVRCHALPYPG